MFLHDRRLYFARDLVRHWRYIRGGELVPYDEDLDPRELLVCLQHIAIADLQLRRVIFNLFGATMKRRFGQELRHVNWIDLVPPMLGDAAERARKQIVAVPCGYYHKFTVTREGMPTVTAETVALPLRHRGRSSPDAVIAFSRDDHGGASVILSGGWLVPSSRIIHFSSELVEIGAGAS